MNVLVLGGTGTVGSHVAGELVRKGADVSVLTRDGKKPVPAGARPAVGDLLDPETIRTAFRGRDAVFLLTALGTAECHEGLMAVNGCRLGGVKKVVFLSIHRVDEAPHLPHFGAKLPIETAIKASGIPFTILRPNNFYQNDYWYKDVMLGYDVYPQPFGDVGPLPPGPSGLDDQERVPVATGDDLVACGGRQAGRDRVDEPRRLVACERPQLDALRWRVRASERVERRRRPLRAHRQDDEDGAVGQAPRDMHDKRPTRRIDQVHVLEDHQERAISGRPAQAFDDRVKQAQALELGGRRRPGRGPGPCLLDARRQAREL